MKTGFIISLALQFAVIGLSLGQSNLNSVETDIALETATGNIHGTLTLPESNRKMTRMSHHLRLRTDRPERE